MTNIVTLKRAINKIESAVHTTYNGGNGGEPPMELIERVGRLEADMATVKTDVAVIRSNYTTKEDLHREINAQTWKFVTYTTGLFVTAGSALVAATYFIAKHTG